LAADHKELEMFGLIKSLLVSTPQQKLIKVRDKQYEVALKFQRSGNLREYARIIGEISAIDAKIAGYDELEQA
jgi:hypothetical protein